MCVCVCAVAATYVVETSNILFFGLSVELRLELTGRDWCVGIYGRGFGLDVTVEFFFLDDPTASLWQIYKLLWGRSLPPSLSLWGPSLLGVLVLFCSVLFCSVLVSSSLLLLLLLLIAVRRCFFGWFPSFPVGEVEFGEWVELFLELEAKNLKLSKGHPPTQLYL